MRGLAGLLLLTGVAAGQAPPVTVPAVHTQPGSQGWPTLAPPTVPPEQPGGVPTRETRRPGDPLPQYPSATAALVGPTPAELGAGPAADRPLPGSLPDEFAKEYAERQLLRTCDYLGNRYTLFPNSLLWAPPLASKREARLAAQYVDKAVLPGGTSDTAFDGTFGAVLGLFRVDRNGLDGAFQVDVFGAAFTRFSGSDLQVIDVRGGIPLTFRRGDWFGKLSYEHTSSYLGDGLGPAFAPFPRPQYKKGEVVVGLGRWFDDRLRVYGQAAYAFSFTDDGSQLFARADDQQAASDSKRKQRYQLGFEWFPVGLSSGLGGHPFVAVNGDFRGENDFSGDLTAQAGWQWRNPLARLASLRVYAEYYTGRPQYGLLSRAERQTGYGIGVACDY